MASTDDSGSSFGFIYRSDYNQFCGDVTEDFASKLDIEERRPPEGDESEQSSRGSFESAVSDQQRIDDDDEEEEEEEEEEEDDDVEFSFVCVNPAGSPISADDVFENGQIRPMYPLFDQSLLLDGSGDEAERSSTDREATAARRPRPPLKKLFIEMAEADELEGAEDGTYCVWKGKSAKEATESLESCRKSNSTGFSRRWRFRDLVHRSSSDGKDAFVFLNPNRTHGGNGKPEHSKKEAVEATRTAAKAVEKAKKPTVTAHEKHYVKNRAAKESDRRKSYLPYRQDLVGLGFFTNVNGMTRNIHPF